MPGSSPGMTRSAPRLLGLFSGEHAHDVGLLHDQELLAVELDLGARPFAEQHAVADLEVDRNQLAGLVAAARAHGGDFALRRLFLGAVGNDDAALGLLFGIDALDHDAVVQRTEFGFGHEVSSSFLLEARFRGLGAIENGWEGCSTLPGGTAVSLSNRCI